MKLKVNLIIPLMSEIVDNIDTLTIFSMYFFVYQLKNNIKRDGRTIMN